jgi:hypothetical protein
MYVIYDTAASLYQQTPCQLNAFVPIWHEVKDSVMAVIGILQPFTNSHFYFLFYLAPSVVTLPNLPAHLAPSVVTLPNLPAHLAPSVASLPNLPAHLAPSVVTLPNSTFRRCFDLPQSALHMIVLTLS